MFEQLWKAKVSLIEDALQTCLPPAETDPAALHQAMRYSLLAGGKRLRPVLCLAAAEACGGDPQKALSLACAVECIHTYSLIHDDLPCMDNDDFRRGRPTNHKVFGEGIAVLAGDALLTRAFELAAEAPAPPHATACDYVRVLTSAAGSHQLIAGQVADLQAEGEHVTLSLAALRRVHERKTGALIRASLRLGAMVAGASAKQLEALESFGAKLGLAFQVLDDILDITQTTEQLGKSAGKDEASWKSTYPSLLGIEGAREEATKLTAAALQALEPLGEGGRFLRDTAHFLLSRQA